MIDINAITEQFKKTIFKHDMSSTINIKWRELLRGDIYCRNIYISIDLTNYT